MSQFTDVSPIERLELFLRNNNQQSEIEQLTPDASTREYFRINWNGEKAIACVYPFNELCQGQFAACLDVTNVFQIQNLPVARILYASNEDESIIVHEDFGDRILRDTLVNASRERRKELLNAALSLIARIQMATETAFEQNSISSKLKFDEEKLNWELDFFKTHYFETLRGTPLAPDVDASLSREFAELSRELEAYATVLTHRDFHAANLMLGEDDELKIIDHQDARLGSVAYDPVSLLLDRITIPPNQDWLNEKKQYFLAEREKLGLAPIEFASFDYQFELMTIQRCLKAIGTFSFQSANRGRTYFIQYINPMLEVVLSASKRLAKFPTLQKVIEESLSK
ncbi:MAG: aminoglycoside phosphotransferase family protein [Pyrinomonadaceae bacterium]